MPKHQKRKLSQKYTNSFYTTVFVYIINYDNS